MVDMVVKMRLEGLVLPEGGVRSSTITLQISPHWADKRDLTRTRRVCDGLKGCKVSLPLIGSHRLVPG